MAKEIILNDFKSLSPQSMTIDGDKISVNSILDFDEIDRFFAFLYMIHKCGYYLYAEKEQITFDGKTDDSMKDLLAVMCFTKKMYEK